MSRLLPLALLLACEGADDRTPLPAGPPGALVTPVTGDPPALSALVYERYLVRLPFASEVCPPPTDVGWEVEPLFADDDDDELGRYCVYENATSASPTPFVGLDPSFGEPQDLGVVGLPGARGLPSRLLLAPSGVDGAALEALQAARFAAAAGRPVRLAAAAPVPASRQPRVVLIDTVRGPSLPFPYDTGVLDGPLGHGHALAVALQELTCASRRRCPVQIGAEGALTRAQVPDRGAAAPGLGWGTPDDLARAIVDAVADWRDDRALGRVGPLILNLSVGWHPLFGGGVAGGYAIGAEGDVVEAVGGATTPFSWAQASADWPPDVAAVFAALRRARCEGALVFAAAGNASAGPRGNHGPLLPAGWEGVPPAALGACPGGRPMPEPHLPLLHAVGAVDAAGDDLPSSRIGARPKLLAMGDHLVADPANPFGGDAALSGSSVSTAVVSATAALVAAYLPRPTAGAVLDHLLDSGALGGSVSSWAVASTGSVRPALVRGQDAGARVVRVCDAVQGFGYTCPAPAPALAGFGEDTDPAVAELLWAQPEALSVCPGWTVHRDPLASEPTAFNPCPQITRWSTDLAPWVLPQPPTDGCGSCFLDLTRRRVGLDPARLAGWTEITLMLETPTGPKAWSLPQAPSASPVVWSWRSGALPAGVRAAGLAGVVDDRTVFVPLPVVGP